MKRRIFLKKITKTIGAAGFFSVIPSGVWAQTSSRPTPSNRICMAIIGVGKQGLHELNEFLNDPRVQVVAVCDVNELNFKTGYKVGKQRIDEFYQNQDCKCYSDYRRVLERPDIDAVYVGTPDHWHAPIEIQALRSGKDVYGQKPLTHTLDEGRRVVEAVDLYRRVFQTGSQQRSSSTFRRAVELVLGGYIGKLKRVEVGLFAGAGSEIVANIGEPVPTGLDWDFFVGPAPATPFNGYLASWYWRWSYDFGGGTLMDWVGHHVDIAQWGMGTQDTGPLKIHNITAKFVNHPIFNTASEFNFTCTYANGVEMTVGSTGVGPGGSSGVTFHGEEGTVFADRSKVVSSSPALDTVTIPKHKSVIPASSDHFKNFFDCIYSRNEPIAPARFAHRSASIGQIATIAIRLGRKEMNWNPKNEMFVNDDQANQMLRKSYRGKWFL